MSSGINDIFTNMMKHSISEFSGVPEGRKKETGQAMYVVGSKIFRPDIERPRQMKNAVRDI